MAELATIARPYAEALFKAVSAQDAAAVAEQVGVLAQVAGHEQVRQFADNPKVGAQQVFDLLATVARLPLGDAAKSLLRTVIDNGRLAAPGYFVASPGLRKWVFGDSGDSLDNHRNF